MVGSALKGKIDTIKAGEDALQVTYNGAPLYLNAGDKAPGDAIGISSDTTWTLLKP